MYIIFKLLITVNVFIILSNCTEKISYNGKIFDNNTDFNKLKTKTEVLQNLGYASFVDPIDNKFFYLSEKKITKNFYDDKIDSRQLVVFDFDNNGNITLVEKYNLEDENKISFVDDVTENDLVKRGLVEKIFGGVGKEPLYNTSE